MRPDLVIQEQSYLGRRYWVVKDPIALKYYRFEEKNSRSSADAGRPRQSRGDPTSIRATVCSTENHASGTAQLLGMLHRSALVVLMRRDRVPSWCSVTASGRGVNVLAAAGNVLCIRFRGIDPDRSLAWLNRRLGWLFSWPCMSLCLVLALGALLLVTVQFDVFPRQTAGVP